MFYAMLCHPLVQKKAQEEIDLVVGSRRLPSYEDWSSLPYVEAVYREIMRWRPVTPLGVAHAAFEDDVYKGYFVAKGLRTRSTFPGRLLNAIQVLSSSPISGARI